jgi:hypothetical protein
MALLLGVSAISPMVRTTLVRNPEPYNKNDPSGIAAPDTTIPTFDTTTDGEPIPEHTTSTAPRDSTSNGMQADSHDDGDIAPPITSIDPPPTESPAETARSPLAVRITNSENSPPQSGLSDADIVFEYPYSPWRVFLAVYIGEIPEKVGPIWSGRSTDAVLLKLFEQPVFIADNLGTSDDSIELEQAAAEGSIIYVQENQIDRSHVNLDNNRTTDHRKFILVRDVYYAHAREVEGPLFRMNIGEGMDLSQHQEYERHEVYSSPGEYDSDYNPTVIWQWDGHREVWDRFQGGRPHLDEHDQQINAENVLILNVEFGPPPGTAGHRPVIPTTGGEGILLADGREAMVDWAWDNAEGGISISDGSTGEEVSLPEGRLWIHLVSTD